jgi:hypothetical protein
MLLRSFTKHVNDQNWFAVALDFFIVVMGVFVGLQVANWSDNQSLRTEEIHVLQNLAYDLEGERENIEATLAKQAENQMARKSLAAYSSIPDAALPVKELDQLVYRGLWRHTTYKPSQPTLKNLTSSGTLNLLNSPDLRRKLQEYDLAVAEHAEYSVELQHMVFDFSDPLLATNYFMPALMRENTNEKLVAISGWFVKPLKRNDVPFVKSQQFQNTILQLAIIESGVSDKIRGLNTLHSELLILIDERLKQLGSQR